MSAEQFSESELDSNPSYQQLLDGLVRESYDQDDPARAAASRTLHHKLQGDTPLVEPIAMFARLRQEYDLPEKLNLLHSALIYFAALDGRDIPLTEEDNVVNLERFESVYREGFPGQGGEHDTVLYEKMAWALYVRELKTTMASRYGIAEYVMQAHRRRFPDGVRVLDVGSSIGQGLKALALKDTYGPMAFPYVRVLDKHGKLDMDQTLAYNDLRERPSIFREGVGVDIESVNDGDVALWALSNLRYRERQNPEFMRIYDLFNAAKPANVSFYQADFTNTRDVEAFIEAQNGQTFDLVIYNTVLYQMARSEIHNALSPLPDLLSKHGIGLVQDSIEVTGRGLHDLVLTTANWDRWNALAYDNAHPENGWQKIAESKRSRFEEIQHGAGTLAIQGFQRTPATWPLHA